KPFQGTQIVLEGVDFCDTEPSGNPNTVGRGQHMGIITRTEKSILAVRFPWCGEDFSLAAASLGDPNGWVLLLALCPFNAGSRSTGGAGGRGFGRSVEQLGGIVGAQTQFNEGA